MLVMQANIFKEAAVNDNIAQLCLMTASSNGYKFTWTEAFMDKYIS